MFTTLIHHGRDFRKGNRLGGGAITLLGILAQVLVPAQAAGAT